MGTREVLVNLYRVLRPAEREAAGGSVEIEEPRQLQGLAVDDYRSRVDVVQKQCGSLLQSDVVLIRRSVPGETQFRAAQKVGCEGMVQRVQIAVVRDRIGDIILRVRAGK